jgi:DNA-binding MarR family transcriptional regulator
MVAKKKKPLITRSQMGVITNAVTNEMESVKMTMIVSKDKAKYKNEPFTLLFQASTRAISRTIKPVTAKMLIHLCAIVEYNNFIPQGKKEMALELGYSLRQVERALIELEQMKVIIKSKHREDSRMVVYHINPYQSWKGDIADRKKRIAEHNPNQLKLPMFGIDEKNQKQLPNNTDFLNM